MAPQDLGGRGSVRAMERFQQPSFGRRLRELRQQRGLSQASLAGEEMSTGYLSRLESGARPPTARVVEYLSRRLGVPVSAFQPPSGSLAQALAAVTSSPEGGDTAELLADALTTDSDGDTAHRWQALWLLAHDEDRRGRYAEELRHLRELTRIADELGVPALRARARAQTARCLRALGDNDQAHGSAEEAYRIARDEELPLPDVTSVLVVLVSTEAEAGRLPEARAHAEELRRLAEKVPRPLAVEALWAAAAACTRQGDNAAARDLLEQALQLLDSHDDLKLWMRLRLAAASLYLQADPPETQAARARLEEAEAALALVGTPRHEQEMIALKAQLAYQEGRPDEAWAFCERLTEGEVLLSFRDRARWEMLRSRLLIHAGRREEGIRNLQALAQQASDSLNVDLAADIWRTLAQTLARIHGPGS